MSLCHVDKISAHFQIVKLMLHVSGPTKTVWVSQYPILIGLKVGFLVNDDTFLVLIVMQFVFLTSTQDDIFMW